MELASRWQKATQASCVGYNPDTVQRMAGRSGGRGHLVENARLIYIFSCIKHCLGLACDEDP